MGCRWKRNFFAVGLTLTVFTLVGCDLVDKTVKILVDEKPSEVKSPQPQLEPTTPEVIYNADTSKPNTGMNIELSPKQTSAAEKVTVVLYFANQQGTGLVCQQREVEKVTGMARKVLEELLKGPGGGVKAVSALPVGTRLLDLNIKSDGVAVVNFSKELQKNHTGGSGSEALTVYSIVNTLCQFPTVKGSLCRCAPAGPDRGCPGSWFPSMVS